MPLTINRLRMWRERTNENVHLTSRSTKPKSVKVTRKGVMKTQYADRIMGILFLIFGARVFSTDVRFYFLAKSGPSVFLIPQGTTRRKGNERLAKQFGGDVVA